MLAYPVVLEPDDNGTLLVTFPDVPEAVTFGEDEGDALKRAVDALETMCCSTGRRASLGSATRSLRGDWVGTTLRSTGFWTSTVHRDSIRSKWRWPRSASASTSG
ncbi:MAG: type toxin-antitoxin system HicB family antitoxin [Geminicoccaceae bacterium]|nr:type toxin-antitoxin system HicB family antitoxin [Geminicoccaceae bacterium]